MSIFLKSNFLPDGNDVEGRCQRDINWGDLFTINKHFVGFHSVLPPNDIVMGPLCQTSRPRAGILERDLSIRSVWALLEWQNSNVPVLCHNRSLESLTSDRGFDKQKRD